MKIPQRFESIAAYHPNESLEILAARIGLDPQQIIKLDANENPYGSSPKVALALAQLSSPHLYPDAESRDLRARLEQLTGVPRGNLLVGSGADELIDLLLRVLLDPGDRVLICPPNFSMYALDTLIHSGQVVEVPRRSDFSLDLAAIRDAVNLPGRPGEEPKLLFLASPNNPDGRLATDEELDALLELPLLLVLDEAYIEFTDAKSAAPFSPSRCGLPGEGLSRIRQVPERNNLVVLRTFSKWAGLAGLRIGYGAFPDWLVPALWKGKPPYNVNAAAQAAALASLQDVDTLIGNVDRIRSERQHLSEALASLPFLHPFPSQANFILCRVMGRSAAALKDRLAQRGILIRYFDTPELADCIRISVGRPQDTDRLIEILKEEI